MCVSLKVNIFPDKNPNGWMYHIFPLPLAPVNVSLTEKYARYPSRIVISLYKRNVINKAF